MFCPHFHLVWMLLKQIPPDDILHFMSMPVDTGASYADIPVDNHPWSIDDVTFICDYVDPETAREHADFFARIPVATGSDGTNVTPFHSKPIVIPLLQ